MRGEYKDFTRQTRQEIISLRNFLTKTKGTSRRNIVMTTENSTPTNPTIPTQSSHRVI